MKVDIAVMALLLLGAAPVLATKSAKAEQSKGTEIIKKPPVKPGVGIIWGNARDLYATGALSDFTSG